MCERAHVHVVYSGGNKGPWQESWTLVCLTLLLACMCVCLGVSATKSVTPQINGGSVVSLVAVQRLHLVPFD